MTARNDITGDLIATRGTNSNYAENYDKIFGQKLEFVVSSSGEKMQKCGQRCWLELNDNGEFICEKPNCNELS